jgi:uncharacterized membrane protein (UPF0127 family)
MPELPAGNAFTIGHPERNNWKKFNFSVAITARELMGGLSGVASLEPFDGMVFDFGCRFSPIMTPKGLRFPVDVAFVTDAFKIVEIHRLDPEYGFTQGTTRSDIQYVLEVPVGFFDLHSFQIGDFLFNDQTGDAPDTNRITS